jgi:multidrug efflux pump subunit AcrA (membrane-fusion protein)
MPLGSAPRRAGRTWAAGAAIAAVAVGGWFALGPTAEAGGGVETAEAVRGDFIDVLPVRGEIRARRTVPITAPQGAGDLQIVFLAPNGAAVKRGDVVVRFDTSTTDRQLAEKRSALREAEAEIQRARADAAISAQAARSDETKRHYDVERARLDVSTSDVVSRLEAQKAAISLGAAQQRAREAATKVTANQATSQASMGALERRREKALADVRLEETRLQALTLTAPLDGVITLGMNFRAGGPFAQREWRAGDRAWAGASIAQIPALDSLYVLAKVDETDRGQLKTGLDAEIDVQAAGSQGAAARITAFSALAKVDFGSIWPPPRLFDVQLDLGAPNPALRPGMTAAIRIRRDKVPGSLLLPTRALFPPTTRTAASADGTTGGTPAEVFVLGARGFERRSVRVARRGPDKSAIADGVRPGEKVALERPEEIIEP